jgi:lysylphosphatidylglycerol synthetase-like protein (DUF2156 family)
MPLLTIVIGILLCLVGLGGYVLTEMRSWTALIPAILGGLFLVCGFLARALPQARKHFMHAALLVAIVGLLGSGRMLAKASGTSPDPSGPALVAQVRVGANAATAGLCLALLGLGIRSFVVARAKRAD